VIPSNGTETISRVADMVKPPAPKIPKSPDRPFSCALQILEENSIKSKSKINDAVKSVNKITFLNIYMIFFILFFKKCY